MTALCGFAVAQGWSLVEFARPAAGSNAGGARAWIGVPAFDTELRDFIGHDPTATAQQRSAFLTRLLAVRPMSSAAWLSLAGARLATGQPFKDVLAALDMSSVTGPNEANVMWERGIFCLLEWEVLPPEFQQRASLDIAGPLTTGIVTDAGRQLIRGVLSAKTPQTRAQLASLLQIEGVEAAELKSIGLSPSQAPAVGP